MIKILFFCYICFVFDNGLFRISERHECKKAKGQCNNCKAWSCYKYNLEYKNRKALENEEK